MPVQSIIFDKKYWTINECKRWLHYNGFNPIKNVHATTHFYRWRISEPIYKRYAIKKLNNGIELVLGF